MSLHCCTTCIYFLDTCAPGNIPNYLPMKCLFSSKDANFISSWLQLLIVSSNKIYVKKINQTPHQLHWTLPNFETRNRVLNFTPTANTTILFTVNKNLELLWDWLLLQIEHSADELYPDSFKPCQFHAQLVRQWSSQQHFEKTFTNECGCILYWEKIRMYLHQWIENTLIYFYRLSLKIQRWYSRLQCQQQILLLIRL